MADNPQEANKFYITVVSLLTFLIPVAGALIELAVSKEGILTELMMKWFIFSAVGIRLFAAGIKQIKDPAFTAKEIFHIQSDDALPIVRELGFANLCFGLVGIISLFIPSWRIVSCFASGLYYGIAGFQHLVKKPAGINEQFALITDMVIFVVLVISFFCLM